MHNSFASRARNEGLFWDDFARGSAYLKIADAGNGGGAPFGEKLQQSHKVTDHQLRLTVEEKPFLVVRQRALRAVNRSAEDSAAG
eukprot:5270993-Pyramimonas_sp.AAC.1